MATPQPAIEALGALLKLGQAQAEAMEYDLLAHGVPRIMLHLQAQSFFCMITAQFIFEKSKPNVVDR